MADSLLEEARSQEASSWAASPPRPSAGRALRLGAALGKATVCVVFLAMILGPVSVVVVASLTGRPFTIESLSGPFTLDAWRQAYSDPGILRSWWDTLRVGVVAAVLSALVGSVLAWLVSKSAVRGVRVLRVILLLPLFLPTLLTALGVVFVANAINGVVGWELVNPYSYWGLVFAMTLVSAPFVFMLTLPTFENMSADTEEAAQVFSRNRLHAFLRVHLPLSAPATLAALILVFLRLIEIVDLPLMLGYPADIHMFSVRIYTELYGQVLPRYGSAMALACSIVVAAATVIGLFRLYTSRRDYTSVSGKGHRVRTADLGRWSWAAEAFVWLFVLVGIVLPLGSTLVGSFQGYFGSVDSGFTLDQWRAVFGGDDLGGLVRTSVLVGLASAAIVLVFGLFVAVVQRRPSRWGMVLEAIAWTPWLIPGMIFGIGLLWFAAALVGLGGTMSLVVMILTFAVIYTPLGVRAVMAAYGQIAQELEDASRVGGRSPAATFVRITLPLLGPALVTAGLFVFVLVVRDTNTALFIVTPENETVGVHALTAWREGSAGRASVAALLIVVINLAALGLSALVRLRLARARRPQPLDATPRKDTA